MRVERDGGVGSLVCGDDDEEAALYADGIPPAADVDDGWVAGRDARLVDGFFEEVCADYEAWGEDLAGLDARARVVPVRFEVLTRGGGPPGVFGQGAAIGVATENWVQPPGATVHGGRSG